MTLNISPLFHKSLIDKDVYDLLPKNFVLRPLEETDYYKGYLNLLSHLTEVGDVSWATFLDRYLYIHSHRHEYFPIVIEDTTTKTIVAAGTVFVERKFIHQCSQVAHMEDVVTHKDYRGKRLGIVIMKALRSVGKNMNCYKVILDCKDKNVAFYEKAIDMKVTENQMAYYYRKPQAKL